MAGATKRTSRGLVLLALLFVIIVIILCLMPYYTHSQSHIYTQQNPKNRPLMADEVLTDTASPTTTTTTTTTTTVPNPTVPPATQTTPTTTQPPPPPPPPTTTPTDTTSTTTSSPLTTTMTSSMETTTVPTTEVSTTTSPPPPPTTTTTTPDTTTTTTSSPLTTTMTTPMETSTVPTTEVTTTTSPPPLSLATTTSTTTPPPSPPPTAVPSTTVKPSTETTPTTTQPSTEPPPTTTTTAATTASPILTDTMTTPVDTSTVPTTTEVTTSAPPSPPLPLSTTQSSTTSTTESSTVRETTATPPTTTRKPPLSPLTTTTSTTTPLPPPPPSTTTTTTTTSTTPLPPLTTTQEQTESSSSPPPSIATSESSSTQEPSTTISETPTTTTTTTTDATTDSPQSPTTTTTTPDTTEEQTESSSSPPPSIATSESSSTQEPSTTISETPTATTTTEEVLTTISVSPTNSDSTTSLTSTTTTSTVSTSTLHPCPLPPASPDDNNVCKTPACKTLAARMLDLMDHSGREPCEDFYQYACGGVTDDPLLDPESRQRETLRLIGDSLKDLSPEDPQLGPLKVFYDSCTAAEGDSTNKTMWLSDVKAIVNTIVGPFGGGNTAEGSVPTDDTPDITLMLVAMMKIHFSPFFDLLLDVAEDGTDRFVLMLTPPLLLSPFSKDMAWAMCYEKHLKSTKEALESPSSSYDINNFYEIYSECVGVGEGLQARIQQMKGAVKELGLMDYFNYTNHKQGPDGLLVDNLMDVEFLLQDLDAIFPRRPDLRENHLKRKFKKTTLSYLQQRFSFPSLQLNWVTLVEALLGHSVKPDSVTIHLFFEDELYSALDHIDGTLEPERVQRILLILLAERLYTDLVKPAQYVLGKPEYCLQVTTELLGDFVSSLYLHHLPRLPDREQKIKDMIRANTKAAEKELIRQPNLKPDEKAMWLNKLEAMSGETPSADPSIYILQGMNGTTLNDNFVNNCLALLSRYRSLLYQQYQTAPSAPSVLWSHFLRPFSASGISLYAPNKFLVPYAALEAPLFYWDVPNYVNYAGVGFMIAHEMMHSFDETGVRYNGTRQHTLEGLEHYVSLSECLSPKYRSPQSLTDASGLRANFRLGRLPLNEVLADSGAVKLAWEAYEQSQEERQRNKTAAPVPLHSQWLPWLELKPLKVYYLRIAQTQCTATTDIHMLSLMENEHLPPRLRVNLMLHNDPLFTEAFNCPVPAPQCPYVLG